MITLPTTVTSTSTSTISKAGASSLSNDGALDNRADAETLSGAESLPRGFLNLLARSLFTLAQQGAPGASLGDNSGAGTEAGTAGKVAVKSAVNNLLAALDNPEALQSLLQPTSDSVEKEDLKSEQPLPVATVTQNDLQALQALYAMLPNSVAPAAAATAAATGDLSEARLNGGDKRSALNGLSSASSRVFADTDGASSALAVKNSDAAPLTNAMEPPGGQTKAPIDSAAAGNTPSFQQMVTSAASDKGEKSTSADLSATIAPGGLTTGATLLTPTTTSAVSAPSTPLLNAQLGSPEWQQALGQQILMFSRNGQQTAQLHLHPQDLGSIQISLKLDNDMAQLTMISNHSQVRDALEAAIPQLRASMAENGINLGQSNVSSDAFQQGRSFAGQQDQQRNSPDTPFSLENENEADATPIAVPASLQARIAGKNAIDIFA